MAEHEITKIDQTTYDFLKSRLTAEIASDVKSSIFKQYWLWIAGFTAGVALLGIVALAKLIPDTAQQIAKAHIEKEIAAPLTAAKAQLTEFATYVAESRKSFEKEFGQTAFRSAELKESLAHMKRYSDDVTQDLLVVRSRLVDNRTAIDNLRDELVDSIKKDLVTVPDFEATSTRISDLATQLLALRAQVQALPGIQSQSTPQEAARLAALKKIADSPAQNDTRRATVFIQFAIMTRDFIKTFAAGLKEKGWTVPPEERLDIATGLTEIRYYYTEDAARADRLSKDIAEQLGNAGFAPVTLKPEPRLDFKRKPKPGTLEIWFGVLPKRA